MVISGTPLVVGENSNNNKLLLTTHNSHYSEKTKIIYWTFTILFVLFMGSTAVPDMLSTKEAVAFLTQLGYPLYFVPFIGVAKLLGCIALLVPGYPRIKEWAYAGFTFDLIGAIYSAVAAGGYDIRMLIMLLPIGLGVVSYLYFHKMLKIKVSSE